MAPSIVAFAYGPIVLAGKLGTEGLSGDAQIIKNERTSGNMLNASIEVPVLVGVASELHEHVRPIAGQALTFETVSLGLPHEVQLAPYYLLAHERYTLYWNTRT